MKKAFLVVLCVLVGMYLLAELTLEKPRSNVVRLRWATDPNPARLLQTRTFSEKHPGIEITVEAGTVQKIIVQCATGTGPDVIDVYDVEQMSTYVQAGILLDLTEYAKRMGFGVDKTYPALADALRIEGKQYRFPCNVWANCVIYNKAVFDDHGVAYPKADWTTDDFIETGRAIKNNPSRSGEQHIPLANINQVWMIEDFLIGMGGRLFSEDGLESRFDGPEAIAAMQLYHDLIFEHGIIPTAVESAAMSSQGGWGAGGLNWFGTGKAAMLFIGRWYIVQVPKYQALKGNLGAVPLPRIGGRPSGGLTDARAAGINLKSEHIEESLLFLQYLAGEDYGRLIVQDGDSLPPNPKLARTGADLVNEAVADPCFHQPFIDAIKRARPADLSAFIDPAVVSRWLLERIALVENQLATPEEAMTSLAGEVNRRIRTNLERRPDLRRKYKEVTGTDYVGE